MISSLSKEYNFENLCLSGGVALNCVANGKILKKKYFKKIWIQPASGDAGGALGAAQAFWYNQLNNKRIVDKNDSMRGSFLGPAFTDKDIEERLLKLGANFSKKTYLKMIKYTARALSEEKAVGWFQGRMEFGPRALGGRSILGDPRSNKTQKNLNLKIKFRESFRPFAPSILLEKVAEWFDLNEESPYMLLVSKINKKIKLKISDDEENLFGIEKLNIKRSLIPAVTHVDCSARIQTVNKNTSPVYHDLIEEFYRLTNVPVLVNTSFNIRGEPIVNSPEDAFRCFMGTNLDLLVISNFVLTKEEQQKDLKINYRSLFELD